MGGGPKPLDYLETLVAEQMRADLAQKRHAAQEQLKLKEEERRVAEAEAELKRRTAVKPPPWGDTPGRLGGVGTSGPEPPVVGPPLTPQTHDVADHTMQGERSGGMTIAEVENAARQYDYKYEVAKLNGDVAGMEAALAALALIIWEYLKGHAKKKGEQDKLDQVREQILRNAPNMAPHLRHLSASELRDLRNAPTPGPGGRPVRHRFDRPRTPPRGR